MSQITIGGTTLNFKDSAFTGDQWEQVASWVLNGGAEGIDANAQIATEKAAAASASAAAARNSATSAGESATAAANSATAAKASEDAAQSWAVGGTGTREGEDTNNAKYWAEQAQQSVGGVASFNGRAGSVVPQAGDYDKEMVGLGNVDNTSDLEKPISTATQTALNSKPNMVIAEIPKGRMRGDINGIGKVGTSDELLNSPYFGGTTDIANPDSWVCDINEDGHIDSTDVDALKNGKLYSLPFIADFYNNWTYHKVDNTSGYWTTELSIPDITVEMAVSVICGGTVRAGTFIKVETFSGGVRIYANYPPIEALPCTVSYSVGAGGQFIIADTGVSETYVQDAISSVGAKYVIVKLTASGWGGGKEQIVSVPGVKNNSMEQLIIPTPLETPQIQNTGEYYSAGIRISARADDELTFSCDTIPTTDIFVVLVIIPIVGKFEG